MKTKWMKKLQGLGDFLFTWLPMIVNIICCTIVLFPWSEFNNPEKKFWDVIAEPNAQIALLFLTYTIIIAKNNFDLNRKVNRKLDSIREISADELFLVRNELESLEEIFETADSIAFSGGHLSTVIISHSDALNNFLVKGHSARFILPNPLHDFVISEYAEKLMVKTSKEQFKASVLLSLSAIKQHIDEGKKVDVRLYNTLPAFGMQIIEAGRDSKINVELYTQKTKLSERLLFPVPKKTSREMYDRFSEQFDILWKNSKKIEDIENLEDMLTK